MHLELKNYFRVNGSYNTNVGPPHLNQNTLISEKRSEYLSTAY